MNEKLVQIYVEGLMEGYMLFDESEMKFATKDVDDHAVHKYAVAVLDAEYEAYQGKILSPRQTRRTKEFKAALKIYNSPLSEALK